MNARNKVRRIPCNHKSLVVVIAAATLLGIASASSAQVFRGARRVPAESNPAKASGASAPQTYGQPGAPDATTTIDGKRLPAPDPKFGGVIRENAAESKPWWCCAWCRPRVRPTCC